MTAFVDGWDLRMSISRPRLMKVQREKDAPSLQSIEVY